MGHVAPLSGEATALSKKFMEVFSDASPEGKIHIMLAGHEHGYWRINPGTKELRFCNLHNDVNMAKFPPKYILRNPIPDNVPFTMVTCNVAEGMVMEASPDKLTFKSHRWNKIDGGYHDAFEIMPDGSVKDLAETVVVPLTPPAK